MCLFFIVLLLFFLFGPTLPAYINPNCDYQQDLVLGQEYFIYNQEYPNPYRPFTSCRWNARSPYGTVIVLNCNDVNIPPSYDCQNERLVISRTGNANFDYAQYHCGNQSFEIVSRRNFLTIGLFSGRWSHGGTFLCSLAAVRVARNCTCSKQPYNEETKIIGGQEARVNEFPWMAVLVDFQTYEAFCGAVIISPRCALTAAHCLIHYQTPTSNTLGLLVGDHNLATGNDTAAAALYIISSFYGHPRFNSINEDNDIAVVKTSNRIKFGPAVGPVCLPFRYGTRNLEHETVTELGWGFMEYGGNKADTLQKVNLSVVSNSYCQQMLAQRINSTQICTWAFGKDSCFSDSGGPVLWKDSRNKRFFLVGIISFGIACATKYPGVNTRVTSFLSWIVSVTSDAEYCFK